MLHFSHYGGVDLCNDGEIDRDDILLVTTAQKHGLYREFLEQRHAGVVNVGPIPSAANIATLRVELPSFMRSSSYSS
ncbi:MAG: hypothetical protein CMM26_00845 [Rhodospirillaceae bacterium]|nr:hypothetical protein [Rhodospirillaceae bacterium]|tara:strand:- start:219 stop:449 length:231 start_codon:yes stop_codon:yes gene_type:complete